MRAALYVCEQRERARTKFGEQADDLFFDRDGLEMASSLPVARHRAARFGDSVVADLCCGAGGDLLALAERGPCVGVDIDPARATMAAANSASHDTARVVVGDAAQPPVRCEAAVIDPARRTAGRRTGRPIRGGADDYQPALTHLDRWRRQFAALAIKVSPALDLDGVPDRQEVEYVSWGGQCREAVLWYGNVATHRRRASLIDAGIHTLTSDSDQIVRPAVDAPGAWLYDPDPAVVRSHLVGELAQTLSAWLLTEDVAYLSARAPAPTPWARGFRVLAQLPYRRKTFARELKASGWQPGGIRRRHFPVEPEMLRRQLGRFDPDAQRVELVCTRIEGAPTVFICAPEAESAR